MEATAVTSVKLQYNAPVLLEKDAERKKTLAAVRAVP